MATSRSFSDMLNEYLPNSLLFEEMIKRDWFLQNLEIDNSWKGGQLIVPFEGSYASTVEFGQLASSSDISEDDFVRGTISSQKEAWATLILNHRDLMEHDGRIPETTFLSLVPKRVESLMDKFKMAVSCQLGTGPHFAKATADGTAGGVLEVDHIDRLTLNQKVSLDDDNSAPGDYYVIAININNSSNYGAVTLSATRGGAAANISAYTTAQNAKLYHPGVQANGSFTSVRDALLSAANGGSATLHGQTKLAYPMLQAVNISGADITASNILDKLFDAYTKVRQRAKGNADTIVMSFKHLGSVLKLLETQKGPFVVTKNMQASLYGWSEIEITSVKGVLKLVGIVEMDDDVIFFLDLKSMAFRTNGGFRKRKGPDGREWFEVRNTTGYAYIVDMCLFGEMEHNKPGNNAILYSINY